MVYARLEEVTCLKELKRIGKKKRVRGERERKIYKYSKSLKKKEKDHKSIYAFHELFSKIKEELYLS